MIPNNKFTSKQNLSKKCKNYTSQNTNDPFNKNKSLNDNFIITLNSRKLW